MKLSEVRSKRSVVVTGIDGGSGAAARLEALGIKAGSRLTVISSHFWGGPVTVKSGQSKVSIGRGMAKRIQVEISSP